MPSLDLIAEERARIKAECWKSPCLATLPPPEARSKKRKGGQQLWNGKVDGKSP